MDYSQKLRDLHDALEVVSLNGQATAAADLVIGAVTQGRDQFSNWSLDASRRDAYQRLDDALTDVIRFRGPFAGRALDPVEPAQWDDLMHAIERAYNSMWAVQEVQGTDSEWQATLSAVADLATGTVTALPGVIRDAVHFTAGIATDTVGGLAGGLLPLWPIVVAAVAVVVVGGIALSIGKQKGLVP